MGNGLLRQARVEIERGWSPMTQYDSDAKRTRCNKRLFSSLFGVATKGCECDCCKHGSSSLPALLCLPLLCDQMTGVGQYLCDGIASRCCGVCGNCSLKRRY